MVSPADFAGKKAQIVKIAGETIALAPPIPAEYLTPHVPKKHLGVYSKIPNSVMYRNNTCRFCEKEYTPIEQSNYSPPICSKECLELYVLYLKTYSPPFFCAICSKSGNINEPFYTEVCSVHCLRKAVKNSNLLSFTKGKLNPPTLLQDELPACRKAKIRILASTYTAARLMVSKEFAKRILSGRDYKHFIEQGLTFSPPEIKPEALLEFEQNSPTVAKKPIPLEGYTGDIALPKPAKRTSKQAKYFINTRKKETFKPDDGTFKERVTQEDLRKVKEHQAQKDFQDFLCPNPFKKTYRTVEEAENFIQENHAEEKDMHPYTCRCGGIHIGHDGQSKSMPQSTPKPITVAPQVLSEDKRRSQAIQKIHAATKKKLPK